MKRLSIVFVAVLVVGCSPATEPDSTSPVSSTVALSTSTAPATTATTTSTITTTTAPTTTTTTIPTTTTTIPTTTITIPTTARPPGVTEPPEWLGTRPLPVDEDGVAAPVETPPELVDRRFTTEDLLPPPETDGFEASFGPVPAEVAARSTWTEECPVALEDLAYVTVTFVGFDAQHHTGELLVAASQTENLVGVFQTLFEEEFPIEQMRITSPQDLDAPPTGDGNETSAFVCRPVTGGSGWSEHAYGLAVDINPFHNPYVRGERVLPELAGAYLDRDRDLPGMITPGDVVTTAFADIGWEWGGDWTSLKDYQHFSLHGR